jgi:hypothetical protein
MVEVASQTVQRNDGKDLATRKASGGPSPVFWPTSKSLIFIRLKVQDSALAALKDYC